MTEPTHHTLTRGSLLARNVAFNMGGLLVPAISALVAVPILVRGLGEVRFGVLALAWTALGYFSLFDFGIGRAVTHAVADRAGSDAGRQREIGAVIWTSLLALLPLGLVGATLLYVASPGLASMLGLADALHAESALAFRILAAAIPFATVAASLRGALEAKQLFGVVNALRVPHGVLTFVGPALVLPFSSSLVPAAIVLAAGRAALCVAYYVACARSITDFRNADARWNTDIARRLLSIGGWMQVSNMVSPLMATLDRFVVGGVLGVGLVTYYTAPYELVTKMWLFTMASLPVFFSALATTAGRDAERTTVLFDRLQRVTLAVVFVPTLVLVMLAPDILRIWLGPSFVEPSTLVMQVLAIAVFVNMLGQGAFTLIQGLGRADVTARLHLAELPFYALLLWIVLPRFGILGAAIAWSVRAIADTGLLLAACPALLPRTRATVTRMGMWLSATVAILWVGTLLPWTSARPAFTVVVAALWLVAAWRWLLTAEERQYPAKVITAALRPEQA